MSVIDVVFAEVRAVDRGVLGQVGWAVLVAQLGVVDGWCVATRVLAGCRSGVLHAEKQAAQGASRYARNTATTYGPYPQKPPPKPPPKTKQTMANQRRLNRDRQLGAASR